MTAYRHLTSPLQLRGQTLRNRIVFGAHTNNMSDQGFPAPGRENTFWNGHLAVPR